MKGKNIKSFAQKLKSWSKSKPKTYEDDEFELELQNL